MLEAAPFHLPESSLGLLRVIAKPKGTYSPYWVLQPTSNQVHGALFSPMLAVLSFAKAALCTLPILFSPMWV